MSLLNVYVGRQRAWMGVDTEAVVQGSGETFSAQEMVPLLHINCITGGRGRGVFLPLVYLQITQHPVSGFDKTLRFNAGHPVYGLPRHERRRNATIA